MIEEILRECVIEMVEDPDLGFKERDTSSFYVQSWRAEKLGKGIFYACKCAGSFSESIYVSDARVDRKKEEIRNKKIDYVLDRQS